MLFNFMGSNNDNRNDVVTNDTGILDSMKKNLNTH